MNNKIKNLIPTGFFNIMTRLVLINAIYFKKTWQWKIGTSDTYNEDFKITPDNIVKIPLMNMCLDKSKFNYADTEDAQILKLPYKGEKNLNVGLITC